MGLDQFCRARHPEPFGNRCLAVRAVRAKQFGGEIEDMHVPPAEGSVDTGRICPAGPGNIVYRIRPARCLIDALTAPGIECVERPVLQGAARRRVDPAGHVADRQVNLPRSGQHAGLVGRIKHAVMVDHHMIMSQPVGRPQIDMAVLACPQETLERQGQVELIEHRFI